VEVLVNTSFFSRLAIAGIVLAWVLSPAQSSTPATPTSDQQMAAEAKVRVHGMVRTAKGLPVPGATVRVVHLPSGQAWMSATDENGKFSIHGLPPGRYRVEARHLGLGMSTQESMFLGSSGEAIEMTLSNTATPPASSATGAQNTPSSPMQTAAKAGASNIPKVTDHAGGHTKRDGFAQVEPNGQPSASEELGNTSSNNPGGGSSVANASAADAFLINGTVGRGANAQSGAGFDDNASGDAPADDTAEGKHKKKRASSRSRQGHGKSAAANQSSGFLPQQDVEDLVLGQRLKHLGSNRVRLTFYDQYGNSALNAEPFALTDPDPRRVAYYKERGGVSLGGPFVLPHIFNGRDRTFFFVNYEIDRHREPLDLIETVPLPAERQGDFTARGLQLFNPLSNLAGPRTPIGSVIPPELLNPTSLALLNLVPLPNLPGLVQNYHRQAALAQALDRVNVRMLHTFSPDLNLQAIYNVVEFSGQNATLFPSLSSQQSARAQNFTLGLSQNWSPHLLNDTRVNFSRIRTQNLNGFAFSQDIAQQLGIIGVSTNPIDFGAPTISLTNYTGITDANPLLDRKQTFRFTDNFAYTMTKHTLRAGGEVRYRYINTFSNPTPRGDFTFTGLMTSQLSKNKGNPVKGTGYDLADFLLGLPQTTSLQYGVLSDYLRDRWYVAYVQDDWRIYPRFSVNYGVRYEYVTPLFEKYNHMVNLLMNPSMTAVSMVIPGATTPFGGSPLPDSLIRPDTNNWAPRLGIAWRPLNSGPVIRAGYGIFYNGSIYEQLAATMLNQPPFALAQTSVTSPTRLLTLNNGFPGQGSKVVANTAAVDPNYHVGYAQIWNLTVETPISSTFTAEATYTGTRGTHLDLMLAPNRATPGAVIGADLRRRIPNAPDFRYETSGADSLYNGVQIRVQRRESNGFRFLTLYTFSKSLDDASAIGVGARQGVVQDINNIAAEWGLSSFDVRHTLRNWLSYELPFGDRKPWLRSGAGAALLGNWRISTITQISSGLHFTPLLSGAFANGTGALYSQRPDIVGNPVLSQPSPYLFFNTAAFALPGPGQFGDARRGSIVGPGFINVNASLGRTFHFGSEGRNRMEFRWEVQNVLNMVNYSGLSTVLGSADFGRVKGARPMRSMDVLMRVHF
jgi:trimeric autotransporter adhesin